MHSADRITIDPQVMGGKPCIRGMRVTVASIAGLIASGASPDEILADYSYLEPEDIAAALSCARPSEQPGVNADRPTGKKPRPNHQRSLQILRSMEPRKKLAQVFKLNERTLKLFRIGLRRRFPALDAAEFERVYLQMRERCHNRNY